MDWRADCRMAVALDDTDYDMGRRCAARAGVSGGWEGAISEVVS